MVVRINATDPSPEVLSGVAFFFSSVSILICFGSDILIRKINSHRRVLLLLLLLVGWLVG